VTVVEPEVGRRPASDDQRAADGGPGGSEADPAGPLSRALVAAVRGYQTVRWGRPTGCRFLPSCSEYTIGAIERHGALRGSWLAVKRMARCHPWGTHGLDPVPDRRAPCLDH
jgi:uncharacterized protein